ncbi:MAG TPA: FIST N-terminal domain-containing protein [Bryobacteraceae bacterium]|nr:FIST N-terminal domain-containing protein [Bryobacteraceae bacterium]HOQ47018.1 FIST N-terminal domain-containing protein [Bryobacteraceae bacterium]HPQ16544.1 FIST N-terminal domain-containing protein [Bryobacteraceae bacterium]HPU71109.1 FIST N-terminal domain-containing protein [Bryobacteraceae bacterium]
MIRTAYSTKELSAAVAEIEQQCAGFDPHVVLCFASPKYGPAELSRKLQNAYPKACTVGCTTAGEIVSGRMLTGSAVAMCLGAETVEGVAYAVVQNPREKAAVRDALGKLEAHSGKRLAEMDIRQYVGIVLADGLSGAEEQLMERIGDLTDVFFVGGSAGDDLKFERTHVMAGGQAYTGAAVLMLLKLRKGFDIIKTQSFVPAGKTLVATEVDEENRKVVRFNGKPAVEAYAEAVGVDPAKVSEEFMNHPLGLMVEGEPFVRSPQRVQNGAMLFYCRIVEGAELEVLNATDIVADTRAAVEAKKAELGGIAGIVDFHCILRTLKLRAEQRCDEYGAIFNGIPAIGFSTYGEAYLGHINQTSTMLVFR